MIVTNAQLFIADYDPADVSLSTGELPPTAAQISPIDWIRFRKSFIAGGVDLGHRTVMIVSAAAFWEFLKNLSALKEGQLIEGERVHIQP